MDKKLQQIREVCIKANPELVICGWCGSEMDGTVCDEASQELDEQHPHQAKQHRPIRLADVLLAMYPITIMGELREEIVEIIKLWKNKDNNLENQSEETIEFIYGVIK